MGRLVNILLKQRPADALTIIFLLFLTALTLIFYAVIPKATYLIILYMSFFIMQIVFIRLKDSNRLMGIIHNLVFPVLCVLVIFDSLGQVVHYVNPEDIDPLLIKLDYIIFRNHPTVILEGITSPLLTDIFQISYTTYYFIPVSFGIVLLLNNRGEEFNRSVFFILLCYYLSYLGYILMPAIGPRFTINHLQTIELQGLIVTEPIQNFLNYLEGIKRDAFPSGHTAIPLTVLYLAHKFRRKVFWIMLPIVSSLIFSTVYCRYHYVVDVIAGFGLTFITILLGECYYAWWFKWQSNSYNEILYPRPLYKGNPEKD